MKRQSLKHNLLMLLLRIYLIAFAVAILLPLCWTIYTSVKTNQEFFADPWALPTGFDFSSYIRAWDSANIGTYFFNSLYITVIVVALNAILGSMTAYVCTRFKLRVGNAVINFFMLGLFVPTVLCIVTIFLQMRSLGLISNHFGLILLYTAVNMPFTIYVLAGFFRTLPHELEEAAHIDGSGLIGTFWRVMLPLAKPGIATVCIFNFLGVWNEYLMATTILLDTDKSTLPVGLVALMATTNHQADWVALFAGMVIVMIPLMIIYLVFQKYITSGMTAGAVKG